MPIASQAGRPPAPGGGRRPPAARPAPPVAALCLAAALAAGCTRMAISIEDLARTATAVEAQRPHSPSPTPRQFSLDPAAFSFAAVWVTPPNTLALRQPAGIAGSEVGSLPHDQRDIRLTGQVSYLGSSIWVEVRSPLSGGWVNGWYLTEQIEPAAFCDDDRVPALIERLQAAVTTSDGGALAALVNPRRGLAVRHDWWNPEVTLPRAAVPGLFVSADQYGWGQQEPGGRELRGAFRDIILPRLSDVLFGDPEWSCGSLRAGTTMGDVRWPAEYTNLNFYSLHRPDRLPGSQFNWRTLAIGFEYIDDQPYITVLVLYRGEV